MAKVYITGFQVDTVFLLKQALKRDNDITAEPGHAYPRERNDVYVIEHNPHLYPQSIASVQFANTLGGRILSIIPKQPIQSEDPEIAIPEDPNVTKIREISDKVIEYNDLLNTVPEAVKELLNN
ncbi:hypothetical protein HOD83_01755 [Candidatus Woesearchaeota archaeon]|jgi:hypothetical protein|nr:hypothetical protein [Candidatus Woesearchaeota archaeon]MBT4114430.1 hypothetical protein [Candidatus Woesearchaeota archaeon]MBT4248293.1 hypothetical protein [Candidatus Woesearchaeota archaeon]